MFGKTRTPWSIRRKTLSHPPSVRPQMEQLEDRTVPSTFNSLLGVGPHAADLRAALTDVESDVTALTGALATNTSVQNDLSSLSNALGIVAADLANPNTAAATTALDLGKLAAAENTLATNPGTSGSPAVQRDLRDLSRDITHVQHLLDPDNNHNGDNNRDRDDRGGLTGQPDSLLGQAADVPSDLAAVTSDVEKLTAALGANALNTVSADLATVTQDLRSGLPAATALQTLVTDQAALAKAVGTGATAAVQQDLRLLRSDVTDLSTDVRQLTNGVNRAVADLQADASQLTRQLGPTASGALTTLNGDLTTLASDLAAGKAIGADLQTVGGDVNALIGQIPAAATHTFYDLATDLTNVALAVSVSAKV